jgi:hypothetical protein
MLCASAPLRDHFPTISLVHRAKTQRREGDATGSG